jgi:hypothetical protein
MGWWDGLVHRPALYARHEVRYLTATNWRTSEKRGQIDALKRAKRDLCCSTCDAGAAAIIAVVDHLFGNLDGASVTTVPCGHSRVPNCLGNRLARSVAERLGLPFVQYWADRFVSGSSHPKEFKRLPPLTWIDRPQGRVLLIDDVASSGWHMEEALTALRAAGAEAMGIAWIGGRRKDDGDHSDDDHDHSSGVFAASRRRRGWSLGRT